ncbi:MAG: type restriction enzyme subunit [Thermodesulfobacteriota bacterium]|nr:type restriction enzyme subunit [Thermodesulfobacteriota bacterium]
MTPSGYTEDALVEQPAIDLLAELGWEIFNAYHEFDHGLSPLGRETKADVVLKIRLRESLRRLNPEVSVEAIHQAIEELTRDRSRTSLAAANREIYLLLKNGVRFPVAEAEGDGETGEKDVSELDI